MNEQFIEFLKENRYVFAQKNPNHVPGEGYSGVPYFILSVADILLEFETFKKHPKIMRQELFDFVENEMRKLAKHEPEKFRQAKQGLLNFVETNMKSLDKEGQKDLRQKLYKIIEAGRDEDLGEPEEVQHIEVTTSDFKEIDFITYDATGSEVHLVLCLNETTGDLYVIDNLRDCKILSGSDQLFAFADTLHYMTLHMKKLGEQKMRDNG